MPITVMPRSPERRSGLPACAIFRLPGKRIKQLEIRVVERTDNRAGGFAEIGFEQR